MKMTTQPISQSNPYANYLAFKGEIDDHIQQVLDSGWYILGVECRQFENEFARWNDSRFAVGVANGTDAIEIALRALQVGPGDRVITVSHTAVATVSAISRTGASPCFADIDDTYNLCADSLLELIEQGIDQGTLASIKAIIVVHLYGLPANLEKILKIASKYNLPVIEDCAQAHGATYHKIKVGNHGVIGCFSFYPTKNLGALGDAGLMICNDESLYDRCMKIRQYGWQDRLSQIVGVNSRLDEVQAAVLRVKLPHLNGFNQARQKIAESYRKHIIPDFCSPVPEAHCEHVYHQFVLQFPKAEDTLRVSNALQNDGIGTAVHYPLPVHQQPAYQTASLQSVPLSRTESLVGRILSLPIYPELSLVEVEKVCHQINQQF